MRSRACVMLLAAAGAYGQGNVVTDWASIVQPAIHNAAAPRPPASAQVLHTIVTLAVYDAVMAVQGGYEPYAAAIKSPAGTDVRAAVATAAYRTARARVAPSQVPYLDAQYSAYLLTIADGSAKTSGIQVGTAAADAMLALRANDGLNNAVAYTCSSNPPPPGEFEPNGGCGTQPVDAHLGQVRLFTFASIGRLRPETPGRQGLAMPHPSVAGRLLPQRAEQRLPGRRGADRPGRTRGLYGRGGRQTNDGQSR